MTCKYGSQRGRSHVVYDPDKHRYLTGCTPCIVSHLEWQPRQFHYQMSDRSTVLTAMFDEEFTGTRVLIVGKAQCMEVIDACDFPGAIMSSGRPRWRQLVQQCPVVQKASRTTDTSHSYDQPCLQGPTMANAGFQYWRYLQVQAKVSIKLHKF